MVHPGQDGFGGKDPEEGSGLGIVFLHEGIDSLHEFSNIGEQSPWNVLPGQDGEAAFHLIDPWGVDGSEMQVEPGPPRQLTLHLGVLMSAVVIDAQMDLQAFGHTPVNLLQEGEELLMSMAVGL